MKGFLLICALIFVSIVSCDISTETDDFEPDASESIEMNTDDLVKYINEMDPEKLGLADLDLGDSAPDVSGQSDFDGNIFDPNTIGHNGLGEISFGPNGFQRDVLGQNDNGQLSYGQEQSESGAGDFVRGLFGIQRAEASDRFHDLFENQLDRTKGADRGSNRGFVSFRDVHDMVFNKKVDKGDDLKAILRRYPEIEPFVIAYIRDHMKLLRRDELCKMMRGKARLACLAARRYAMGRSSLRFISRLRKLHWKKQDIIDLFQLMFGNMGSQIRRVLKRIKDWK